MTNTTICAISTPAGSGGIAVGRISGPDALNIVSRVWQGKDLHQITTHTAHLGKIIDPDNGQELDTALLTYFKGPHSFTGEDVVELSVHGSPWIQRELIMLLIRQGATMAEHGEFTRRAMLNGKIDAAEAEAIADMIAANSRTAQRIALSHLSGKYSSELNLLRDNLIELASLMELELDFSEEDVEFANRTQLLNLATEINAKVSALTASFASGRAIKEGIKVVIAGATNAGKSTILNALLGQDKAIVSNIHGTTRDIIEDTTELNGLLIRFIDTAGLRETIDPIEQIGIDRARQAITNADIILHIIDPANPQPLHLPQGIKAIAVINKADLQLPTPTLANHYAATLAISALNPTDVKALADLITAQAMPMEIQPQQTVTNARHYHHLLEAQQATTRIIEALHTSTPTDFIAQDLRHTLHHISSITTPITTPTLLSTIFSKFCIGK